NNRYFPSRESFGNDENDWGVVVFMNWWGVFFLNFNQRLVNYFTRNAINFLIISIVRFKNNFYN
ncbi:MAG TPA: hypothetical protein P5210_06000, partial [Draconibacterium sp.]|nr:hypothetical protein [Draconibacterium sp.]